MIIGVDHIALSARDIAMALKAVEGWGYRPKFVEWNLRNDPLKSDYLEIKDAVHDISFCQPLVPYPAIELTAYRKMVALPENSPFKVVFSGKNPGSGEPVFLKGHQGLCAIASQALGVRVYPVWLGDFETVSYYLDDGSIRDAACAYIKCVMLDSPDIEGVCNLWTNFGFAVKKESGAGVKPKWKLLEYKSHLPAWSLNLLLMESNSSRNGLYKLDMPGFTCIALLTNNVATESRCLTDKGFKTSGIFSLRAGGNLLKISLVSGESGECIELIELAKKKKNEKN